MDGHDGQVTIGDVRPYLQAPSIVGLKTKKRKRKKKKREWSLDK